MSIQAFQVDFPDRNDAIVDPGTGMLTRVGRYLLQQIWSRTGKGTGIVPLVSAPLVATGASIADALVLTTDWNQFGTVALGTGCKILPLKPGNDIEVINRGANALAVYPPTAADQIDALGAGVAYTLNPGKLRVFQCWNVNPSQFDSFGS